MSKACVIITQAHWVTPLVTSLFILLMLCSVESNREDIIDNIQLPCMLSHVPGQEKILGFVLEKGLKSLDALGSELKQWTS